MRWTMMAALCVATSVLGADAPREGRITRESPLLAEPRNDAGVLARLTAQEKVSITARAGGWYQVTSASGTGWVRLSGVRFAAQAGGGRGGLAAPLRLLQSGRAAVTTGAVTTGVRGLTEQELAASTPDPAAVAALESHAVERAAARSFAATLGLKAVQVKPLKAGEGATAAEDADEEGGP